MAINLQAILPIIVVLLALCLVASIIMRLTRFIIVFLILLVVVPATCTIMFGDGSAYVSSFASFFAPSIEEKINEGYQFYHDKNAEDPFVDLDQLEKFAEDTKQDIMDTVKDKVFGNEPRDEEEPFVFNNP